MVIEQLERQVKLHSFTQDEALLSSVNNLPAMRKTWVRSLGWEDPLGLSQPHFRVN